VFVPFKSPSPLKIHDFFPSFFFSYQL
jgi:hypothetical protein